MKLKSSFVTQDMFDEQVMFPIEKSQFNGIVHSNPTAAFIVDCLKNETTKEEIVSAMLKKYDASEEEISEDVDKIINTLRGIGALDE